MRNFFLFLHLNENLMFSQQQSSKRAFKAPPTA